MMNKMNSFAHNNYSAPLGPPSTTNDFKFQKPNGLNSRLATDQTDRRKLPPTPKLSMEWNYN